MRRLRAALYRPSRIGLRLFAFNLLVVFVPVIGVLYLDVYEARLRQVQEAGLVQQARILAAALGDRTTLDGSEIARAFARLERRSDARFRVYDLSGTLIADSARQAAGTAADEPARYKNAGERDVRRRRLYQIGAWLANTHGRVTSFVRWARGRSPGDGATAIQAGRTPPEVRTALEGRYGSDTRVTGGQRSVTLFSAVPVRHDEAVTGAVVASQSTLRILLTLYDIRLRIFEIVIASLAAAVFLTALASTTIVGPLTRLRRQASALAERRGPLPASFPGAERRDEIGALARALGELTRRTNDHIQLLQSFSADVSHELKNPLASIRTAAEMMAEADSSEERRRFQDLMVRDVARLERLVSGLRDVARVEGQIEADVSEAIDLPGLMSDLVASLDATALNGRHVDMVMDGRSVRVIASPERLRQVFENLLANAISFAPAGSGIAVTISNRGAWAVVTIDDSGPGIPETHRARVFQRFFTYRPGDPRREHVGLGLAIAKQIVESYGGEIAASNRPAGGARFEVRLPIPGPRSSNLDPRSTESGRRR
jgi:two-component system sensor histidine kinase ChvG